jgi:ABC-type antimicrobial peptide transport system permease subunit
MDVRSDDQEMIFLPALQNTDFGFDTSIVVRSILPPESVVTEIRSAIHEIDPNLPTYAVMTMNDMVNGKIAQERLVAFLCTAFAVLALLLSAVGLYGVLAYSVTQRTQEIGIRIALGATRERIFRSLFSETALFISVGIAAGLGIALACGRLLRTILYGVSPTDLHIITVAALILAAVSALAAFFPASRATRIDPNTALRYE